MHKKRIHSPFGHFSKAVHHLPAWTIFAVFHQQLPKNPQIHYRTPYFPYTRSYSCIYYESALIFNISTQTYISNTQHNITHSERRRSWSKKDLTTGVGSSASSNKPIFFVVCPPSCFSFSLTFDSHVMYPISLSTALRSGGAEETPVSVKQSRDTRSMKNILQRCLYRVNSSIAVLSHKYTMSNIADDQFNWITWISQMKELTCNTGIDNKLWFIARETAKKRMKGWFNENYDCILFSD